MSEKEKNIRTTVSFSKDLADRALENYGNYADAVRSALCFEQAFDEIFAEYHNNGADLDAPTALRLLSDRLATYRAQGRFVSRPIRSKLNK